MPTHCVAHFRFLGIPLRIAARSSDKCAERASRMRGDRSGAAELMEREVEVLEASGNGSRALDGEASSLFEQARDLLDANRNEEALQCLREARDLAPDHAQLRSMLGLAIARVDGDFETSRSLCESAAKQEFFNPDVYLNLAQVYLRFGRRPEALRYLRRGQMIDPGNARIDAALLDLGRRRMPIVPFLPRRHMLNRALGSARSLVLGGISGR